MAVRDPQVQGLEDHSHNLGRDIGIPGHLLIVNDTS